ncbi:MAG: alpha/beta fold hydrolase [Acidimicrobiia bacterium]
MATATLNGVEMYYETVGAGERLVLTHGSWTDGTGWLPVVDGLAKRFEVVTWDRRGHSRSQSGDDPGSRAEDASDLAALIEHLGDSPVHAVGNSYGSIITLTLAITRPDLVSTVLVHEPPLWALLAASADQAAALLIVRRQAEESVATLIEAGDHRAAAQHFVDNVALGPGSWDRLPETLRAVMESNAPTFLDEHRDPTALSIDVSALVAASMPMMFTRGTESPPLFSAVIDKLTRLVPTAQVRILAGAGHIPHATHPVEWVANTMDFHDALPRLPLVNRTGKSASE